MTTLLMSFVIMLLVVTGMAVGVLFGRRPISGSCGGMKALGMDVSCEICGGDPDRCETSTSRRSRARTGAGALFYRADD
ncbi:MAG TPA: (Na+)-NQR maturation NqrM [Pseudomonadales bacterium]